MPWAGGETGARTEPAPGTAGRRLFAITASRDPARGREVLLGDPVLRSHGGASRLRAPCLPVATALSVARFGSRCRARRRSQPDIPKARGSRSPRPHVRAERGLHTRAGCGGGGGTLTSAPSRLRKAQRGQRAGLQPRAARAVGQAHDGAGRRPAESGRGRGLGKVAGPSQTPVALWVGWALPLTQAAQACVQATALGRVEPLGGLRVSDRESLGNRSLEGSEQRGHWQVDAGISCTQSMACGEGEGRRWRMPGVGDTGCAHSLSRGGAAVGGQQGLGPVVRVLPPGSAPASPCGREEPPGAALTR